MNTKRLYLLIIGIVIAASAAVMILFDPETPEQSASPAPPPGHPDIGAMRENSDASAATGKSDVRQEFIQQLDALRAKVDSAPESDTTDVLLLAKLLFDSHKIEESVKYFERYLVLAPKNTDAMLDLSVAYHQTGQKEKSIDLTKRILNIDPDNARALYNLGVLYLDAGKKDDAMNTWRKLISKHQDSDEAKRAAFAMKRMQEETK